MQSVKISWIHFIRIHFFLELQTIYIQFHNIVQNNFIVCYTKYESGCRLLSVTNKFIYNCFEKLNLVKKFRKI